MKNSRTPLSFTYREALNQGLREAFQNDEGVFLIVEND